jgi:hypothetical protein
MFAPSLLALSTALVATTGTTAITSPQLATTTLNTAATTVINPGTIGLVQPTWKCSKWTGAACSSNDRASTQNKQIVIFGSGFANTDADETLFWSTFDRVVSLMTSPDTAGTAWSVQHKDQILFIGYFTPGGPIDSPTAAFHGAIPKHPVRGYATSLDQDEVFQKVTQISAEITFLRPMSVGVVFNDTRTGVTANAAPPTIIGKPFGIAKWLRGDLDTRGAYLPTHELAHASLDFLDEYVQQGFEDLNISQIDVLTPLALLDGSWGGILSAISNVFGVYDMRLSEILANNGSDNIATTTIPATVMTPGFSRETYAYEGGMFFGRGTWHMAGNNIMNGNHVMRGPDDGFAFAHSGSQQAVINEAWGATAHRPNDRLRNAGPTNGWPSAFGNSTKVMIFDGDKLHHYHPTRTYDVQVGWYDRHWKTCWKLFVPYPCYDDVWTVAERTDWAAERTIQLRATAAYGLASLLQRVVCAVGINEIQSGSGTFHLCDQGVDALSSAFLPTIVFRLPYQEITVPASQWFTTYYWRFRTDNGTQQSGFTGWSSFYRTL